VGKNTNACVSKWSPVIPCWCRPFLQDLLCDLFSQHYRMVPHSTERYVQVPYSAGIGDKVPTLALTSNPKAHEGVHRDYNACCIGNVTHPITCQGLVNYKVEQQRLFTGHMAVSVLEALHTNKACCLRMFCLGVQSCISCARARCQLCQSSKVVWPCFMHSLCRSAVVAWRQLLL
jgi:hypothetical protein